MMRKNFSHIIAYVFLILTLAHTCMAVHKEFGLIPIHVKGIKGEPFLVKVWQKSKVWNGSFFLDGTVCHQRKWAVPTQAKIKIPPRGKYEPIDKPQYDEVIVDIQRACDWTLEKMEAGMHEFCYEMEETRKCVDVIVRPPTGKDFIVFRQIFQYTKREDRLYYHIMDILPNERKIGPYILRHYPTSTYAGWALAYTRFGNNWIPGDWRIDYLEDFYRSDEEKKYVTRSTIVGYKKDGEPIFRDLREEAKEYIERGEQFLLIHPNHPMKLRILGQMAWAYCTVHDWQRAYETTKKFLHFLNEATETRSYIPKDVREWQPFFEGLIQELRRRHLVK